MHAEWPLILDSTQSRVWERVLCPIATEMRESAFDLAAAVAARIQTDMPELFPDAQTVEENRVSAEVLLIQLAQSIEQATDPRHCDMPTATFLIIQSGVRRQISLVDLMRYYRIGQSQVWQWAFARITAAAGTSAEQASAVELATRWLFAFIDGATVRAEQAYELEREGWMRSAAASRAASIEEILSGRETDIQRASTQLRYNANRQHIGVVLWLDRAPEGGGAQSMLSEALTRLAHVLAAENTLSHYQGSLTLAGWVSRRLPFGSDDLEAIEQLDGADLLPAGVRASAGEPGHGLVGFRRSHFEAQHARRVASLGGPRAAVFTRYPAVAVAALATADREHALAFATRVLGQLAEPDETTYRLATTLAVYLEENRGRRRAAERLMVHPNTVSYRVRQAEELLGRTVGTDTLDIQVALAILVALPGLTPVSPNEL
ncbi:hypothetical protein B2J88_28895 [Rhodococcus sp. SRB_17]|nr:hypothetical protein [Rhodococcus sp. SRB_17]